MDPKHLKITTKNNRVLKVHLESAYFTETETFC